MKTFIGSKIRHPKLLENLFIKVFNVKGSKVVLEGDELKISTGNVERILHWTEACLLILNEIQSSADDVEEYGHCLLQSLLEDYDTTGTTLYVEQYLMKLYNNLPDVSTNYQKNEPTNTDVL